jgi:peroxiredoxin
MKPNSRQPGWITWTLILAGLYNLAWGTLVVIRPDWPFAWLGIAQPNYPEIWQCVGMIVGVYGIGYLIAARDAARHWPIVLVGLLGKLFGPIGFLFSDLPWGWLIILGLNDLPWWIPFAGILLHAFSENQRPASGHVFASLKVALASAFDQRGVTLLALSEQSPVLLTFLRHQGCTFCREALSDLSKQRAQIESNGTKLAIVHMSRDEQITPLLAHYKLDDISRISDPLCSFYRAFSLSRGRLVNLFGPKVMLRTFPALMSGYSFGMINGDGYQMPGVFLINHGEILSAYRHQTAADRPRYLKLACVAP